MNRTLLVGGFYQPRRECQLMLVRVSSGMKGFHQECWSGFHHEGNFLKCEQVLVNYEPVLQVDIF